MVLLLSGGPCHGSRRLRRGVTPTFADERPDGVMRGSRTVTESEGTVSAFRIVGVPTSSIWASTIH